MVGVFMVALLVIMTLEEKNDICFENMLTYSILLFR